MQRKRVYISINVLRSLILSRYIFVYGDIYYMSFYILFHEDGIYMIHTLVSLFCFLSLLQIEHLMFTDESICYMTGSEPK